MSILSEDITRRILLAAAGGGCINEEHGEGALPFPCHDPEAVSSLMAVCKTWATILIDSRLDITFALPPSSARRYPVAHYLDQLAAVVARRPAYLVHDVSLVACDFSPEELHAVLTMMTTDPRLRLCRVDVSGYHPNSASPLCTMLPLLEHIPLQRLQARMQLDADMTACRQALESLQTHVDDLGVVVGPPEGHGIMYNYRCQQALQQVLSLDRLHTLDVSFAAAATDIISFLDYPNLQSLTLTTMQWTCSCYLTDLCTRLAAQSWHTLRLCMRPSLGGKFAMFGIRHGPGTGTLSRLQDLVSELVTHHGDALELWLLPPSRVAEEELVGDEQHDAADLVLIKREVPRVVALQELMTQASASQAPWLNLNEDLSLQVLLDPHLLHHTIGHTIPIGLRFAVPLFGSQLTSTMQRALRMLSARVASLSFAPGECGGRKELKSTPWATHAPDLQHLHHLLLAPHDVWLPSDFTSLTRVTLVSHTSAAPLTPPGARALHLVHMKDTHHRSKGRMQQPVFDGLPRRCNMVKHLALTGYQVQGGVPRELDVLELHGCNTALLRFIPGTCIRTVKLYHCNKFRQEINMVHWVQHAGVQHMHLVDTSFESNRDTLEALKHSCLLDLTVACGPHTDASEARRGVAPVLAAVFEAHLEPAFTVHWRFSDKYATVYCHRRAEERCVANGEDDG